MRPATLRAEMAHALDDLESGVLGGTRRPKLWFACCSNCPYMLSHFWRFFMRSRRLVGFGASVLLVIGLTGGAVSTTAAAPDCPFQVKPSVFDPGQTGTVAAQWVRHLGEPGNCGDTTRNRFGLLLSKNTVTATNASAGADITGVNGIHLTEIGWDLRKTTPPGTPDGSHCGAGAPRFDVTTTDGVTHFIGCDSPPPTTDDLATPELGWQRLRYDPAAAFPAITPAETVRSISIVFDEGNDVAPELFGAAELDNIDINGVLIGGPGRAEGGDDQGE
jgi:hypothetical protein